MPGIRFKETMDGYLGQNIMHFRDGEDYGIRHDNAIRFDIEIEIDSVDKFIQVSSHHAAVNGMFYCKSIGGEKGMVIENGRFNLFDVDPQTGHRRMLYSFNFNAPDGIQYYFSGFKDIYHDKVVDMLEDMTTLFVRIYKGRDETSDIYGSGVMYFRIKDLASMVKMIRSGEVIEASNFLEKYATVAKFVSFFIAETLKTYTPGPRFLYTTRYENLLLSGELREKGDDRPRRFFFFSGEHDKGFPWGDEETMSDAALLISDSNGGYLRFGITRHSLKGLDVDLEGNRYVYSGELFRINNGYSVSFSEIRDYREGGNIENIQAEIRLSLDVQKYKKVDMSFKPIRRLAGIIPDRFEAEVRKYLTMFPLLGHFTIPHRQQR